MQILTLSFIVFEFFLNLIFLDKVLQSKHDALLERIDELDQECEELREKVMDIEGERDELKDILNETKIQTENLTKTLAEKQVRIGL